MTATAFDPEAKEADDFDTANTHLKFKVRVNETSVVGVPMFLGFHPVKTFSEPFLVFSTLLGRFRSRVWYFSTLLRRCRGHVWYFNPF